MRRRRASVVAGVLLALALAAPDSSATAGVEEGKALFDQQCAGCHTIGGGDLTGPDLAGVIGARGRDWVLRFILDPQQVLASGDPVAQALVDQWGLVMPTLGLTEDQVASLVAFLEAEGGGAPPETQPAETQPAETQVVTETQPDGAGGAVVGEPDVGKALFEGTDGLQNGGPSCISCHTVAGIGSLGGGAIGPDLTGASERYGAGLAAVIESSAFPTMQPLFADNQITPQEAADLAAFLAQAPDAERPAGAMGKLLLLGFGGAVALAALGLLVWRGRLAGVRRPLVDRSRRGRK